MKIWNFTVSLIIIIYVKITNKYTLEIIGKRSLTGMIPNRTYNRM
jgi:hypothetical protein